MTVRECGRLFSLEGRVALVTGASSGIGEQLARALHGAGAHVVLAARREERLKAVADGLERALAVPCDVTDDADRHRLVDTAVEVHGRIDVLVNNAGIASSGAAEEETPERTAALLETNLVAAIQLCRLVGARMIEQGSGSIISIASLLALRSVDRYALLGYAVSKAGLVAATRELAAQWGPHGVRLNAVAPGWFPTDLTGHFADPEQVAWIEGRTALRRPGRIEELDGAVIFLASDASSYCTGQVLAVDGGWTVY